MNRDPHEVPRVPAGKAGSLPSIVSGIDPCPGIRSTLAGNSRSCRWFLSRTPTVSEALLDHFIRHAGELGFNTGGLIFVEHR